MTGMPRPASFIRSTEPKLKRFAIYWTRDVDGRSVRDQIWTIYALDEEAALGLAERASGRTSGLTAEEMER